MIRQDEGRNSKRTGESALALANALDAEIWNLWSFDQSADVLVMRPPTNGEGQVALEFQGVHWLQIPTYLPGKPHFRLGSVGEDLLATFPEYSDSLRVIVTTGGQVYLICCEQVTACRC